MHITILWTVMFPLESLLPLLSELRTEAKDLKLLVFGPEGKEIFSSFLPED